MKTNKKTTTIKTVFSYIKRYSFFVFLSLLLAAFSVGLTLYLPILIGRAVDTIISQGNVDFKELADIAKTMAVVICLTALSQWLMSIINNRITFQIVRDIRNKAFEKIQKLPLRYIDSHSYGDIVSRVIADADQFSDGLLLGFTQFFSGILTILITLVFMLTINFKITLFVVIITPISLFVASFIAKRTYSMFSLQSKTRGEQTAFIDEMITNQKIVQSFGRQKKVQEQFDEINDRLETCSLRAIFYSSLTNPCTRFVNSLVYTTVALSGGFAAISSAITIGQLTSLLSYANQYTKPFNEISSVITELQNALACAERIFELIEEKPQTPDAADAHVLTDPSGNLSIKDVCFSYTPDKKLIEDFNLTVTSGQRIAIVGPTGCGKTTLINLLMRFYDVDSGSISLDGIDIKDLTRKSLRTSYGMVLQETWLKSGTIKDNIILGKPDASMEEIIAAAKETHAHSFIKRLPDGYDTVIGEDGGSLSQGQKQLLCITRIMLSRPSLLILDEATSSIDTRTEMQIQSAFNVLMEGHTSFIVAHRLSTIKQADLILVMKDGSIIESGTHKQLVAQNGFYAKMLKDNQYGKAAG